MPLESWFLLYGFLPPKCHQHRLAIDWTRIWLTLFSCTTESSWFSLYPWIIGTLVKFVLKQEQILFYKRSHYIGTIIHKSKRQNQHGIGSSSFRVQMGDPLEICGKSIMMNVTQIHHEKIYHSTSIFRHIIYGISMAIWSWSFSLIQMDLSIWTLNGRYPKFTIN